MRVLRHFSIDIVVLLLALAVAVAYGGPSAAWVTAVLVIVEIVFSFDNAAVNAKYLARLNVFWQKMFLSVGILIAVVGMRLAFPFVIVCLSGHIGPVSALQLALAKGDPDQPGTYGYILTQAHPSVAAFGGIFLLMLFLDFLFEDREVIWLSWVERPLMRVGRLDQLSVVVSGMVLLSATWWLVPPSQQSRVLTSGLLGMVVYVSVNGLAAVMQDRDTQKQDEWDGPSEATPAAQMTGGSSQALAGKAALSLFLFLEVLDASFSFDGVVGAFAITPDPLVIALGLGVGALFVRSMTVHLVRQGTLANLRYLEHGAHWAIGTLAVLLLVTLRVHLPDVVVGLAGIAFISAAWATSVQANRRDSRMKSDDRPDLPEHASGIFSSQ